MKRLLLVAIAITLVSTMAFGQMFGSDARARGMGGAMTAVNDDMNTLFYNPAGLAFLRKSYFIVAPDIQVTQHSSMLISYDYSSDDQGNGYYGYYYYRDGQRYLVDNATVINGVVLDLNGDGIVSPEEISSYNSCFAIGPIVISPRLIIGGKYWGTALIGDYQLNPYLSGDRNYFLVDRTLSAVAGLGFNLGPVALGANVRYSRESNYSISLQQYDGPSTIIGVFSPDSEGVTNYEPELKIGAGALVTLGTLNLGLYNADVMAIIDNGDDPLYATNLGVSWMPSDNKFQKKFPLSLAAAADIKNLGSSSSRSLNMGLEIGLNAGDFLVVLARAGYSQPFGMGLELSDLDLAEFSVNDGTINIGATAQLWFAKVDLSMAVPMSTLVGNDYYGPDFTMSATISANF